ncbi:MAG: tRNA (cytidine(34)-2'-O)-methyltransferase [Phycisphaerales bacterium]
MTTLFHVILHQPEIPNNTGNIGRTCIAMGCALHLVRPLGFDTSVHALRRAGLDYWPRLAPTEHDSWESASTALQLAPQGPRRLWLFSTRATKPIWNADLRPGDALLFGKETAGLPDHILTAHLDSLLTLPMLPQERSLNLATAVCAVLCEGVRQCAARADIAIDPQGRITLPQS